MNTAEISWFNIVCMDQFTIAELLLGLSVLSNLFQSLSGMRGRQSSSVARKFVWCRFKRGLSHKIVCRAEEVCKVSLSHYAS
jgi:hypothetical protein